MEHKVGYPLQFKVAVNGKEEVNGGVIQLLGGSSDKVAKEVASKVAATNETGNC